LNSYAYSPYPDFSGVTVSSFAGNSHYDALLSRTLCSQAANCEYPMLLSSLINQKVGDLASRVEDRVLVLASAPLFGWAQEGALKVLEMTAGRFPVMAETYLGLRHGPMSFICSDTMVLCLLSNDPVARLYEQDLVQELRSKKLGYLVGVCPHDDGQSETAQLFDEVIPSLAPKSPDVLRTPFEILCLQLFGYHLSVRVGLDPDSPSPVGVINRVVQGVRIYK
jgi:tagatose-6-phosphate ketose/aldose isomerase